ncbi:hypothetical protein HaLaN_23895 [Haematococcus lacustris]|uniref:Secreted protein n=1 Tax=Haematococcus lacustris TaxID=44745 RepID=A0A699ZSR4_HAELA|nr:hypothetical protein HaLaN_23895 [Haematococcus lacustris]
MLLLICLSIAKGLSSNETAVKGRTAHSVTADRIKAAFAPHRPLSRRRRGSLHRYGLGPYVPPPRTSIAHHQSHTRASIAVPAHTHPYPTPCPVCSQDAEIDGSGRAEAVLSESKARSTQEAPRGCETEHLRLA